MNIATIDLGRLLDLLYELLTWNTHIVLYIEKFVKLKVFCFVAKTHKIL